VYRPGGRPQIFTSQQLGYFSAGGDVQRAGAPGANNVNLLVETVLLNYMALHGQQGLFATTPFFPAHGLGNATNLDRLTAFAPIVSGTITNPL
jgi:hypothetical protein